MGLRVKNPLICFNLFSTYFRVIYQVISRLASTSYIFPPQVWGEDKGFHASIDDEQGLEGKKKQRCKKPQKDGFVYNSLFFFYLSYREVS